MGYQQEENGQNFKEIEKTWKIWDEEGIYLAQENSDKQKIYVLVEFPYPSGSGLHVGHAFSFTGADVYARFKRMAGYEVLFPMGWDAFGLPTENYAIKKKKNPRIITKENTEFFKKQMKILGFSFDWSREINTTDPKYYKWTQWIFVQLFKKGLAYKKEMPINWCPSCKIGLANEEVVDGKCERCGAEVNRRSLSQWIVKITDYADRLVNGLEQTKFIEKVKTAQINWIGKSEGAEVIFKIKGLNQDLRIFTTRPDTLWGATFMVLAPEHPLVASLLKIKNKNIKIKNIDEIKNYLEKTKKKSDMERTELNKEKTGVFSGLFAVNPTNNERIPIWISDFVLASYGTGAIMAVPAHDQRDWEFAKKFGLKIIPVIVPGNEWDFDQAAYTDVDNGKIVNSPPINGLTPAKAFDYMIEWLTNKKIGKKMQNYHLRDWIFSRQHYWGEPIPMVYCKKCGWQPVNEKDLPIELPRVEHYEPTDTGESPLVKMEKWIKTTCPKCDGPAERETDTMPNWAGSDWYFLAYCFADKLKTDLDEKSKLKLFRNLKFKIRNFQNIFFKNKNILSHWLPVDVYIGGDEHNTLHLLYSRFIYQFLWDINAVPKEYPEPYIKRVSHGVILGPDSQRMSKSKNNVIIPEEVIKKFNRHGPDILRLYLMFIGPFDGTMAWNDNALMGVKKFLDKIESYVNDWLKEKDENKDLKISKTPLWHQTIQKVTRDIDQMKFNTAVACLMSFINEIRIKMVSKEVLEKFLILLSPFAPFFSEEQWQKINPKAVSIFKEFWPSFDPQLIKTEKKEIIVQINGKVRAKIMVSADISQPEMERIVLGEEKIKKQINQKEIKKIIFIPGKLINIVI
jgi:leucyl-tRNA synthetase